MMTPPFSRRLLTPTLCAAIALGAATLGIAQPLPNTRPALGTVAREEIHPPPRLVSPAAESALSGARPTFVWQPTTTPPAYYEVCIHSVASTCERGGTRFGPIPSDASTFTVPTGLPGQLRGQRLLWTVAACRQRSTHARIVGAPASMICSAATPWPLVWPLPAPVLRAPAPAARLDSSRPELRATVVAGAERQLFCVARPGVACGDSPGVDPAGAVVSAALAPPAPAASAAGDLVASWPASLRSLAGQPLNWTAAACTAALGCSWAVPQSLRLEPSPYDFEEWWGGLFDELPRCAACHDMAAGNAIARRHVQQQYLPATADVSSPVLCQRCHQTQPGHRDPCSVRGDAVADAACAAGIAPDWRAPPATRALRPQHTASASRACRTLASWVDGAPELRNAARLASSRARQTRIPAHAWALARTDPAARARFDAAFETWVLGGTPYRGVETGHCTEHTTTPLQPVGLEWGDDAWESRAAGPYAPWAGWSFGPGNGLDPVLASPPEETIRLYNAAGRLVCFIRWQDQQGTRAYRLPDMDACDNDDAVRATIKARRGTIIRIFDNPDGRTDDDWAEIRVLQDTPLFGSSDYEVPTFEQSIARPELQMTYRGDRDLDAAVSRIEVTGGDRDFARLQRWMAQRPASPQEFVDAGTMIDGRRQCPRGTFVTGIHADTNRLLCTDAWSGRSPATVNNGPAPDFPEAPARAEATARQCRTGQVMIGFGAGWNEIFCATVRVRERDFLYRRIDTNTVRAGMHACPLGQLVVGFDLPRNELICREVRRYPARG